MTGQEVRRVGWRYVRHIANPAAGTDDSEGVRPGAGLRTFEDRPGCGFRAHCGTLIVVGEILEAEREQDWLTGLPAGAESSEHRARRSAPHPLAEQERDLRAGTLLPTFPCRGVRTYRTT